MPLSRPRSLAAALLTVVASVAPAQAQDTPDRRDDMRQSLRQELTPVQTALREMKAELDANREALSQLKAELDQVREENATLRRTLESAQRLATDTAAQLAAQASVLTALREDVRTILEAVRTLVPRRTPIETPPVVASQDPLSSPAALLTALRERYERDIKSLIRTKDMTDDAFAAKRRDTLERWCQNMARTFRGKTRWLVRLDVDPPVEGRVHAGRLTVLDPLTRQPIGDGFAVEVPARFSDVVRQAGVSALYELDVLVTAAPKFDANFATPGVFDFPPQVGPYVRFGVEAEWQLIAPVRGSERKGDPKQER